MMWRAISAGFYCAAISVPHATLQETVGVVVVPTKGIQVGWCRFNR
jgi:hypothetical protein